MTVWMNLDALPAGTHQYIAFVGPRDQDWSDVDEVWYDEVDLRAGANAGELDLTDAFARSEEGQSYDLAERYEILGIADQSTGEWVYLSEHGRLLRRS